MMRFIFCLLLSFGVITITMAGSAYAENGLVYNSTGSSKNSSVFNSSKSSSAGPIALKSMIRGATENTRRSVRASARATPYTFGKPANSSALSVSPREVRARQKIEQQRSEEYSKRQGDYDVSQRAKEIADERRKQRASQYSNRFGTSNNVTGEEQRTAPTRKLRKPVFLNNGGFEVPAKVFGTNY